jgi:cation transporter-like permease
MLLCVSTVLSERNALLKVMNYLEAHIPFIQGVTGNLVSYMLASICCL